MRLPHRGPTHATLIKRQQSQGSGSQRTLPIVAGVVVGLLFIAILFHLFTKHARAKARNGAKTGTTGRGNIWSAWPWLGVSNRGTYSSSLQDNELAPSTHRREPSVNDASNNDREMSGSGTNAAATTGGGVDRNTSVRSIMTLPAYSPAARENERILAREGERGGIDVVVEFPETVDEEEQRREEEMSSLYHIREARRAEQAAREERRQARREARARNDQETLAQLRRRAESAASQNMSAQLIAEHQGANRERRVSSVQYAELGVARHDGSRVRANSHDSDNLPLLDSAASMAESRGTLSTDMGHRRGRSASSVLSLSTNASEDDLSAQRTASRTSGNTDYDVVSLNHSRTASASRANVDPVPGSDMGDRRIPSVDPPVYDELALGDAPPYESPVNTRAPAFPRADNSRYSPSLAPQLPSLERLPSIRVTDAPIESTSSSSERR